MAITVEDLDAIKDFTFSATKDVFEDIFGTRLGEHLWPRFRDHNYNLMHLWSTLDSEGKRNLIEYLEKGKHLS